MSKKLWIVPVLVAVVLALGSGASFAMPSQGGGTGIVSVPNALVAPVGELQLAASYQKLTESLGAYSDDFSVWGVQALGGIADRAELWAAYQHANSDFFDHAWGIGGKVQLVREPKDQTYFAVFASYQRANSSMYDEDVSVDLSDKVTTLGIVATKDFTPNGVTGNVWASGAKVFGSAGVMYKRLRSSLTIDGRDVSGSDSLTRPFLGAEFVTADGTTLGLEYRWKDSDLDDKAVWSAVLRHNFARGFTGEIGTTNADPVGFGTNDQNFFVRVGYSFPIGRR